MFKIVLTAKTKKGKEIIKRLGDEWVVDRCTKVYAFGGELGMFVCPLSDRWNLDKSRWIRQENDLDFSWEFDTIQS